MYQRVLLKVSGEALSSERTPLCQETIEKTASDIAYLQKKGVEIGIVVGGGNILRGRSSGQMERNRADHMGMLATAINALALQDALERMQIPCVVLSAAEMPKFCDTYTARAASRIARQTSNPSIYGSIMSSFLPAVRAARFSLRTRVLRCVQLRSARMFYCLRRISTQFILQIRGSTPKRSRIRILPMIRLSGTI